MGRFVKGIERSARSASWQPWARTEMEMGDTERDNESGARSIQALV